MNLVFTEQNNKATPFSLLYLTCRFIFNIHVALSISIFKDKTMNYMQGQLHSYYKKKNALTWTTPTSAGWSTTVLRFLTQRSVGPWRIALSNKRGTSAIRQLKF